MLILDQQLVVSIQSLCLLPLHNLHLFGQLPPFLLQLGVDLHQVDVLLHSLGVLVLHHLQLCLREDTLTNLNRFVLSSLLLFVGVLEHRVLTFDYNDVLLKRTYPLQ